MAKRSRCLVPLRSGYTILWGFYLFIPFPMAISRPCSSPYTDTLPNQITFGFWALISEDVIHTVMLTQGSGSCPDPLLLTFASMLTNATKDANWRQDGHMTQETRSSSFSTAPVRMSTTGLWAHNRTQHQREPSSYKASCLKDCLETMVLREDHHQPHQLLLEMRCPCPY